MKKIIYLTNKFGTGHLNAAEAVREAIDKLYPGKYDHELLDVYETGNKGLYKIHINLNKFMAVYARKTLKASFELTGKYEKALNKVAISLGGKRVWPIIKKENPDIIISAFPMFTSMVAEICKKRNFRIPIGVLVTDTGKVHKAWAYKKLDFYLAPTDETKYFLKKYGADSDKIEVLGFPVREQFYRKYNRAKTFAKHKLDPKKNTIAFFSGGLGVGKIRERVQAVSGKVKDYQILVLCGQNKTLCREMNLLARRTRKNHIKVFTYTNEVAEILSMADLVVTKAGGVSVNELIALKKPMIIYEVIPGQEEPNAQLVEHMGFGYIEKKSKDLVDRINYIFETGDNRRIIKNLENYHLNNNAANRIARYINKTLS